MRAVEFHNITRGETLAGVSFGVESGSLSALITSSQDENDVIVRLLLGLAPPDGGAMTVLGEVPSGAGLLSLRRRIGVVHPSGGLVSNLKVAENVALPLAYHSRLTEQELARRCAAALQRVGYQGRPMELPGNLSLYCRRLVGQARTFIMEPELLVYNAVLGGLSEEERRRIVANAVAFHRENPARTTLFLTSQPETMGGVPLDRRLILEEKSNR
jgi:phospholipid/cholesterol/gamma-HCH transport system ATP-binding protein